MINDRGLDLVKHFEGLRLKAYYDPVDVLTIGYGHTGPDVYEGQVITEAEAEQLLLEDLEEHEVYVKGAAKAPLNEDRLAALVSFAFNVGNGSLGSSTLLKKVNKKDYAGAADEFPRWVYGTVSGKKVKLNGLVRRREAERALFLGEPVQLATRKLEISTEPGATDLLPAEAAMARLASDDYDARFAAYIQSLGLKYFKPYEFLVLGHQHANPASPAYGLNRKPEESEWGNIELTAKVLDQLRERMGAPISTLSVHRSKAYNKAVGGAPNSQHLRFNAVDFVVKSNSSPSDWASALRQMRQDGLFKGGIGTYSTFVHLDTRGENADW